MHDSTEILDVAVIRPEQDDADSLDITLPANCYRPYVIQNQDAIGYVVYQGFQTQGRGFVALIPFCENKHNPELAILYVSKADVSKLPLLAPRSSQINYFPRWYSSMSELVHSRLASILTIYNPASEAVILGQVEDTSQVFPDKEIYRQIHRVEIFTFTKFEPSILTCYERFRGRALEFIFNDDGS